MTFSRSQPGMSHSRRWASNARSNGSGRVERDAVIRGRGVVAIMHVQRIALDVERRRIVARPHRRERLQQEHGFVGVERMRAAVLDRPPPFLESTRRSERRRYALEVEPHQRVVAGKQVAPAQAGLHSLEARTRGRVAFEKGEGHGGLAPHQRLFHEHALRRERIDPGETDPPAAAEHPAVQRHRLLRESHATLRVPFRFTIGALDQVRPGRLDPRRLHLRDHPGIQPMRLDETGRDDPVR